MLTMSNDLIFLHSGFYPHCTHRIDKHFDDHASLQFMAAGAIELWYGQEHYELHGAWCWTGFPGPHIRFHAARSHSFWVHRYVAFQGPLLNRWIAEGLWPSVPQRMPHGKEYGPVFDQLLDQARRSDRWGALRAINLLEQILLELAEARDQSISHEPWLKYVLEQLAQLEQFNPDYTRMAAQVGMGLSTLRRRFKQMTGTTLHGYVLQKRMTVARELLGETDLPIKAIAERLGYNDVYYFSNQFSRHIGVSPTTFRKSRQTP
jgi:AraC-like DNA-binding protein